MQVAGSLDQVQHALERISGQLRANPSHDPVPRAPLGAYPLSSAAAALSNSPLLAPLDYLSPHALLPLAVAPVLGVPAAPGQISPAQVEFPCTKALCTQLNSVP